MGLDQWLYVHTPDATAEQPLQQVAVWRKYNWLHGWMERNLWDGSPEDFNCRKVEVPLDKMIELRDACEKVLANHDLAMDLLPPTQGFFFGGYDLDDWYFTEVREVLGVFQKAIEIQINSPGHEHYYDSWW